MDVSCAFPPGPATPDHIALAEELGFRRAWCYDSPSLYSDVWATLGRAADRTSRIGLGPAVLVPSLRHVMTNAAAIAGLEATAPGRTVVAVSTGFTGRIVLGQRPMRWADVADYVSALRALLRGDEVEWEGAVIKMIHPPGLAPDRPVEVPILIGAEGPKGMDVARELGDGIFAVSGPKSGFAWSALLQFATVVDEGEAFDSRRVLEAAGPAAGGFYHGLYEWGGDAVDGLPRGAEWRASIESVPARTRHLAMHEGHMVHLNDRDRQFVTADMIASMTFTGTAKDLADRMAGIEEMGTTELVLQPTGADIERALRALADMAGLTS
jgi:5,10-methylenetetrahydromethanopterin reductase